MKSSILRLFILIITNTAFATPPYETLKSCLDEKPLNEKIIMQEINDGYYSQHPPKNYEYQYDLSCDNNKLSAIMDSNGTRYLLINNKKYLLKEARDKSVNPDVKPGLLYVDLSSWYYIKQDDIDYICINGALSDTGVGASVGQYYIVEDAFSANPVIYFYFLDKDIVSMTGPG